AVSDGLHGKAETIGSGDGGRMTERDEQERSEAQHPSRHGRPVTHCAADWAHRKPFSALRKSGSPRIRAAALDGILSHDAPRITCASPFVGPFGSRAGPSG